VVGEKRSDESVDEDDFFGEGQSGEDRAIEREAPVRLCHRGGEDVF
jgi:hypothetical protein